MKGESPRITVCFFLFSNFLRRIKKTVNGLERSAQQKQKIISQVKETFPCYFSTARKSQTSIIKLLKQQLDTQKILKRYSKETF